MNQQVPSSLPPFRVLVCGSRTFTNYVLLAQTLNILLARKILTHQIIIVSGTARGADTLGEQYATRHHYVIERYPADWDLYGKSAGYKRNAQMVEIADACVAFQVQGSKGTQHTIDLATQKGIPTHVQRL